MDLSVFHSIGHSERLGTLGKHSKESMEIEMSIMELHGDLWNSTEIYASPRTSSEILSLSLYIIFFVTACLISMSKRFNMHS